MNLLAFSSILFLNNVFYNKEIEKFISYVNITEQLFKQLWLQLDSGINLSQVIQPILQKEQDIGQNGHKMVAFLHCHVSPGLNIHKCIARNIHKCLFEPQTSMQLIHNIPSGCYIQESTFNLLQACMCFICSKISKIYNFGCRM